MTREPIVRFENFGVEAGGRRLLQDITLSVPETGVFGLIGPSGAGKSTLLKSINRLTGLSPGLKLRGEVYFRGVPVRSREIHEDDLRARVGILFQQPVIFPRSILANVLFGVSHTGRVPRSRHAEIAELVLRQTALWDEVRDRLKSPATRLSVGQQQRLCLARALASSPELLLMDEPTSALDPRSTGAIEELIRTLGASLTIIMVTHNLRQARRVCDNLAFLAVRDGTGRLLRHGPAAEVLDATDVPELNAFRHGDGDAA